MARQLTGIVRNSRVGKYGAGSTARTNRCRLSRLLTTDGTSSEQPVTKPSVIDIHSHFLPKEIPNFAKRFGGDNWPWIRILEEHEKDFDTKSGITTYGYGHRADAMLMQGDKDFRPITKACWDIETRINDLEKAGIDHQILCATPILFQWQRDPGQALEFARHMNDYIVELCAERAAAGRLHALCQVPLQDIDAACKEVDRMCSGSGGALGVQIGNHVGPRDLDDEQLVTFLQHCADKGVPVLVHPWDMDTVGGRTDKYMMGWTVSMPMETHLTISSMILGGIFDRVSDKLKICFAHGGGSFPYLVGRMDNAWEQRSVARGFSKQKPSSYTDRFYVDSAVFSPEALQLLNKVMGTDRIMLGSDYPFPLGEQQISSLVQQSAGTGGFLNSHECAKILSGNAVDFFGLPTPSIKSDTSTSVTSTSSIAKVHNVINGKSKVGVDQQWLSLVNPANGQVNGTLVRSGEHDVSEAVDAASDALHGAWSQMGIEQRCALLQRTADIMERDMENFAQAETSDTGKPLSLCKALDVPRAIANLRFFAGLAPHACTEEVRHIDKPPILQSTSYTIRKPVGVVGLVTPWNLPLYLLTWKLAPALVMGNTVVAKPSEITPRTATMLGKALSEAGIPDGVFNVVHGFGHETGKYLVSHPNVAAVSFTGGTETGSAVAALAAPQFKKLSLELGGKNPCIVFSDCDLESTVEGIIRSSFLNSGQICLCGSRILVQNDPRDPTFYERFLEAYAKAANNLKVGNPLVSNTNLGPVVSSEHRDKIQSYIDLAQSEGGTLLAGGGNPPDIDQEGFYISPTIITGLSHNSRCVQEEVFGPVVTVHEFQTEAEAIHLANDTKYGLAAQVWTSDTFRAQSVAAELDAGTIWVNCWLLRELHMPFGGYKASGVNREGGIHSLNFYSETSTVCVKTGHKVSPPLPGQTPP